MSRKPPAPPPAAVTQTVSLTQAVGMALGHQQAGQFVQAESIYRQVLQARPDHVDALHLLGLVAGQTGRPELAMTLISRAIALKSDFVEAHQNLGVLLLSQNRTDEAVAILRRAVALRPDSADAHFNLGNALQANRRLPEAAAAFRQAIAFQPDSIVAWNNLGNALRALGELDQAAASYRRVMSFAPDHLEAGNNLAITLGDQGRLAESFAAYRQVLARHPDNVQVNRNLLTTLLYSDDLDQEARFAEHRRFETNHARPLYAHIRPHANAPDPGRRLRLGYMSSDFHGHPVARNVLPLLEARDRAGFELFLYADNARPDGITGRFQATADHWRPITGRNDAAVAEMVRADGIDILVCLAGRFDNNRPLVCALKPAPVQISFHDPATSGLEAMDYLITDIVMAPRDTTERFTERLIRLPSFYLATPLDGAVSAVPPPPPPSQATGSVTFGCFNNPAKITPAVLDLWARLLSDLPESRLILKYRSRYQSSSLRATVLAPFRDAGIAPERIEILASNDPTEHHLKLYNRIDIALDPFPFCGSTTTYESLWMGVPVVTLPRETMVSRWSASMLRALKLTDLIAGSPEEYRAIARRLAGDRDRLADLRATLRGRVAASNLCDAGLKARHIERAYRAVWRRWCAGQAL